MLYKQIFKRSYIRYLQLLGEILFGVPQGLILGLLLFHKDLYDLVKTDQPEIANYADDNKYTLCIWKKH